MIEVVRNRLVERRQWSVDQQMVMSGIGLVDAGGCHAHVGQTEADNWGSGDVLPIVQIYEIHPGALRRRLSTRSSGGRRRLGRDDPDTIGHHWRGMRDMLTVAPQPPEGVRTGPHPPLPLRLPRAEMQGI